MKRIILFTVILGIFLGIGPYTTHGDTREDYFQKCWSGTPYSPMTILVDSATLDGDDMVAGDEIGIYDGDLCVGAGVLVGTIPPLLQIVCSADDPVTSEQDGFIAGNEIGFKLWDDSEGMEITDVVSNFDPGYDDVFTQLGTGLVDLSGGTGPQPGSISGTVNLGGGGGEITDVEVTAGGVTVNPSSEGSYSISLQQGTYDVVATLTNYTDSTLTGVEVFENQATTGQDITLDPLPGSISGTVTLAIRIGDVTNVEVTTGGETVNPNSSGEYTISGLAPGSYDVTATLTNYVDSTVSEVTVVENTNTPDIDFTLIPTGGGPGWTVNPDAYEYNGTVIAGVFDGGVQIGAEEDIIAAFCGGECRGVAGGLTYPPEGEVVYFLIVNSNETSGDILTFKYWDASEDVIYDIPDTEQEFIPDMVLGSLDPYDPYVLDISVGIIDDTVSFPQEFRLFNSFPNPVKNRVTISYGIPETSSIIIELYNTKGRKVKSVVVGSLDVGYHTKNLSVDNLSSGIYFYKLKVDGAVKGIKKMVKIE